MITLQLISDEDDLCRLLLNEEELATMLRYAKETADGVLEDDPDDPLNLAVKSLAVGLTKFLLDPWNYSNWPKCITCNRLLANEEWDETGQCPFCQLEVVRSPDEQEVEIDEQDSPATPAMPTIFWPTSSG